MTAMNKLPGLKSFFDATMLTSVGHNPGDLTHPKRPFVSTQSVAHQIHPQSPPPPPPPPPPHPPHRHPRSPMPDSASGFAAGDVAERQLGPMQSLSGTLGGKVIGDPAGGKNHVVWVGSDSNIDKPQEPGSVERKKKLPRRPLFSPFKRMLTRDKRRSATEISISVPPVDTPSPEPTSSQPSSQSLDGQHLLHLVRTNDDLTQQLIAKSNAIVNLEATVTDLTTAIDQLKVEVEESKLRDTKYAEDIQMFQEVLANQERDAEARNTVCKEREEEMARLAEQLQTVAEQLQTVTADNEALKTDLETCLKEYTEVTDQNNSQEQLIQDLQATIDDLQEQVNFLSTERDAFKKYFATAKVDSAQKSEELRETIVDLLDKQREITASIRKGLPLGRIALKKVLQKTEQFLEVKAQKQMLQQKVDFLSNKSFVQDMYIIDLRQVICELARALYDHRLTPSYALRRALDRLNLPFGDIVLTQATPYRWESGEETSSEESSAPDTATEHQSNYSDDTGSEYPEEVDVKWRDRKRMERVEEEASSEISGSDNEDTSPHSGQATARYSRHLSTTRT